MKLQGLYRAKVIFNEDKQLAGIIGVHITNLMYTFSNNEDLIDDDKKNYIYARPASYYSKSKHDVATYKTESGKVDKTPRVGSYVAIYFLNGNQNEAYYLPGWAFNYMDQVPTGKNLDEKNIQDSRDPKRRINMEWVEEYNGTIHGNNMNEDVQEFFYIFNNGTYLKFSSPDENQDVNMPGTLHSHKTKPTYFTLELKRFDSPFRYYDNKETDLKRAFFETILEKAETSEGGFSGEYPRLEGNTFTSNYVKTGQITEEEVAVSERLSFVQDEVERWYKLKEGLSATLNSLFKEQILTAQLDRNKRFNYERKESISNAGKEINEEEVLSIKDSDITTKKSNHLNNEEVTNTLETFSKKIGEILIEITRDFISNKDQIKDNYIKKLTNGESFISYNNKKEITKNKIIKKEELIKDTSKIIKEEKQIEGNKINYTKIIENDNFVNEIKVDTNEDSISQITSTYFKELNPADTSGGALELPLNKKVGKEIKVEVKKDGTNVLEFRSIDDGVVPNLPTAKSGHNFIKWTENSSSSEVEMELTGSNPLSKIKFKLSASETGDITLETNKGNLNIKNNIGDISIENKQGNFSINNKTGDINLKNNQGTISLESKLGTINIKAVKINIETKTTLTIKSNGIVNVTGKVIKLNGGKSGPLLGGIDLLTWLNTHVHQVGSIPSAVPTVPVIPTAIKKDILV